MSPARKVAFQVLLLAERGGYASDLLRARSEGLDARDAGLASEIVYGCLRLQGQLDFLIRHFSGRPAAGLDPEVRVSLRMGIYQLRNLDRVPSHAAVAESVDLVKQARKRSAAGFVNAVLRKVDRGPVSWPDRSTGLVPASRARSHTRSWSHRPPGSASRRELCRRGSKSSPPPSPDASASWPGVQAIFASRT